MCDMCDLNVLIKWNLHFQFIFVVYDKDDKIMVKIVMTIYLLSRKDENLANFGS